MENYQKEDDRIIIIKHYKNKGKIKTRTDGIKLAKGKYITILDGDDAFIYDDILYNSLYLAKLCDLDIVEFKLSEFRNEYFTLTYNNFDINKILYQPELSNKFIKLNRKDPYFSIINRSICAKLIKRNIFINIIINNATLKNLLNLIMLSCFDRNAIRMASNIFCQWQIWLSP